MSHVTTQNDYSSVLTERNGTVLVQTGTSSSRKYLANAAAALSKTAVTSTNLET
jgi:hypothetical protein